VGRGQEHLKYGKNNREPPKRKIAKDGSAVAAKWWLLQLAQIEVAVLRVPCSLVAVGQ
jgi:hypothetical protein